MCMTGALPRRWGNAYLYDTRGAKKLTWIPRQRREVGSYRGALRGNYTRLGGLAVGELLHQGRALVHGHDEQRLGADVAKAVQRVGRHRDDALGAGLDYLVAGCP